MSPEPQDAPWRLLITLAALSLAAGLAAPWLALRGTSELGDAQEVSVGRSAATHERGADAPAPPRQGVIAIGDRVLLANRTCLKRRGIAVYDEPVRDADTLVDIADRLADTYLVILIDVGHDAGLVDGQIQRVVDAIGHQRRVVWATIAMPDPGWGEFTFEARTNASIRNVVPRGRDTRVLDWNSATAKHPEWLIDGTTTSSAGCEEYAARAARMTGIAGSR